MSPSALSTRLALVPRRYLLMLSRLVASPPLKYAGSVAALVSKSLSGLLYSVSFWAASVAVRLGLL